MTILPTPRALRALLVAIGLALLAPSAWAQSGTVPAVPGDGGQGDAQAAPEQIDREAIRSLLETLEDEAAREKFIANLRALLEAQQADEARQDESSGIGASALGVLSERLDAVSRGLVDLATAVLDVPTLIDELRAVAEDPERRERWLGGLLHIALVLGAGLVAEWLVRFALGRPRRAIEDRASDGVVVRLMLVLIRTVLDVLPVAAFAAAAYGVLPMLEPDRGVRLALVIVIWASVLARVLVAAFRMLLAPQATRLRLFAMGDETAAYLFVWASRLINVGVYGYFAAEAALLLGLSAGGHAALLKLLGLALALLLVVFLLQVRRPVRTWIQGSGRDRGALGVARARLGQVWHILAVVYTLAVYGVWAAGVEGGFAYLLRATVLTLLVIGIAALAARAIRRGTDRLFALSRDLQEQHPGLQERANRYLPVVQRGMRIVIGIFAALSVLQVWGLDTLLWLGSESGRGALGSLLTIIAVVAGAVIIWELVSSAIARYLGRLDEEAPGGHSGRLHTLLPLARTAVTVALVIFATLIVLSEIGIDIAPLLAGAGVIGLAIGFGAQTLVKDVITGLFNLIEDTIAVGDVVTVAGHTGVVEAVSIRTVRLRDLSGVVHIVPFSDITSVENMTKNYSYALIEVGVAYREDTDRVAEEMIAVGDEMREDETFGADIIGPVEMFGVNELGDSSVVVRIRLMTRPGAQWSIRREYLRRIKKRFDELGIEIPFPHLTMYMGVDQQGYAPPLNIRQVGARNGGTARTASSEASTAETGLPPADTSGGDES